MRSHRLSVSATMSRCVASGRSLNLAGQMGPSLPAHLCKALCQLWMKKQCFYLEIALRCLCGKKKGDNKTGTEFALGVVKKKMNIWRLLKKYFLADHLMWKKVSGSKGEILLTGTEKRFVSWGFLFCARTSVMQVSTLLPSFKLLCTGNFLLLLDWSEDSPKDISEWILSKTDRLKTAKSQRMEEIEPCMQVYEEKANIVLASVSHCVKEATIQLGKIMTQWKIQGRSFSGRWLGKLVVRKNIPILTSW